jgi:peroxiredoxin
MATRSPSDLPLGTPAPAFDLPGTDGRRHNLESARGRNGLVVMFICNHCPYVQAVVGKMVRDARELNAYGVGTIAISSNDALAYPDDSFEAMKAFSREHALPFPYAYDESQAVARAYGAVCTPDIFGFDAKLALAYRGRLDDSGRSPKDGNRREMFEAMVQVSRGEPPPGPQHPALGCSIKWKAG